MKNYFEIFGVTGETINLNVDGTATFLPLGIVNGKYPIAALITCSGDNVRFAFGGTVPHAALGHILYDRQSIRLSNPTAIRTMQVVEAVLNEPAVLHITYEYEIGA